MWCVYVVKCTILCTSWFHRGLHGEYRYHSSKNICEARFPKSTPTKQHLFWVRTFLLLLHRCAFEQAFGTPPERSPSNLPREKPCHQTFVLVTGPSAEQAERSVQRPRREKDKLSHPRPKESLSSSLPGFLCLLLMFVSGVL